jgi:hypothetical protein
MGRRIVSLVVIVVLPFGFVSNVNAQAKCLTDWLQTTRPQLEKALGYSFPELPAFESATRGEFSDPDVVAHLHWRFPHLQGEALQRAIKDVRALSDSTTQARLMEGMNVIRVRREIEDGVTGRFNGRNRPADAEFLMLALSHELVRYALDVRYDLTHRRKACRDAEEWFAWQALVEGRAQEVTRRLAVAAGMEKSFPRLAERFLHVPDVSPDPGLRTTSQSAMRQLHWAHTRGHEFWRYLEEHGMKDAEKEVFAHPPRLTQWIEHPELYLRARQDGRQDLATILGRLEGLLPAQEWASVQQAWTPAMVVQTAEVFGDKTLAERRVESWQEGRSLVWTSRSKSGQFVSLSVVRFRSADATRAFFNFTLDMERKADQKLNVSGSRCRTVTVKGADEAALSERKLGNWTVSALRVRAPECFLEFTWNGGSADLAWAEEVIRLLAR